MQRKTGDTMSEELQTRMAALEAEVKRLRDLVESIKIEDVQGDISITFSREANGMSVSVGDIEGDFAMGFAAGSSGLALKAGDVSGDFAIGVTGPVDGADIRIGDVGGDVSSGGGQLQISTDDDD